MKLFMFVLAACAVQAAPMVYDNGAPAYPFGLLIHQYRAADDFRLGEAAAITDVRYWIWESFSGPEPSPTVEWAIYADAGGEPGTVLASGTAIQNGTRIEAEAPNPGGTFVVDFSLGQSVELGAGTYWFGMTAPSPFGTGWIATRSKSGVGAVSRLQDGSGWGENQTLDLSYQLYGLGADAVVNPEPGTSLLLGLGLGGIALAVRRRRRQVLEHRSA